MHWLKPCSTPAVVRGVRDAVRMTPRFAPTIRHHDSAALLRRDARFGARGRPSRRTAGHEVAPRARRRHQSMQAGNEGRPAGRKKVIGGANSTCRVWGVLVNTPSPNNAGRRRGPDGPLGKRRRGSRGYEVEETSGAGKAGRAGSIWRIRCVLSLRSLKSLVTEEICGRFGSFDGSRPCISAP